MIENEFIDYKYYLKLSSFNKYIDSIDILKLEYQLLPGIIILFDGRTINARF